MRIPTRVGYQRGLTLTGMIFASVVAIFILLLAFKVIPVYTEYFAIQKHFKAMAEDPALRTASRRQIETAWAARASVDDVRAITADQIVVTKQGGGIVVSAEYEKRVHLFRNVSACFEFKPSSE
jgi:hypothetical protein